jgi:integrase/recombinase XerD
MFEGSAENAVEDVDFNAAGLVIPFSRESRRQKTAETLLDTLLGQIRNKNTRGAYLRAWRKFFAFCSEYQLELDRVKPYHFDMWLRNHPGGLATQRQHLAAVRLLFDNLLTRGVVELNPAARATPPRLQREKSHTPVLEHKEVRALLEAIKLDSLLGLRNKALFSVMVYSWARVSALAALRVEDYYLRKGTRWLRLTEKRGRIHEVPVHSKAQEAVDQWLTASSLEPNPGAPLFPVFNKDKMTFVRDPQTGLLKHLERSAIWELVQTRVRACGLKKRVGCHSFRATGITEYLNAGGSLELAQRIAGHSQLATTKIYDRSQDRLTIAEIERLSY